MMKKADHETISNEDRLLTYEQLVETSGLATDLINEMLDHGVIEPTMPYQDVVQFDARVLLRIYSAQRLQHDLGINIQGAALAFDLMDELDHLRNELAYLRELVR